MRAEGLMPHNDRFPLFSRDWQDMDCGSMSCDWNTGGGKCSVPSLAKIGDNGRCEGFKPRGTIKVVDEKNEPPT